MTEQQAIEVLVPFFRKHSSIRAWINTTAIFIAGDILSVMFSFGFGFFVVNSYDLRIIDFKSFVTYWPYLPAFIIIFSVLHLYPGLSLPPAEELRRYVIASFFSHTSIILALYIQNRRIDAYSVAFVFSWMTSVPSISIARSLIRAIFRKADWWGMPAVIFGGGKTGILVVDRLLANPAIGYRPSVILDDNPALEGSYKGIPILTGTNLGIFISERFKVHAAIVAMPGVDRFRLTTILGDSVRSFRNYVLIPDFFGMTSSWMSVRDIGGILGLYTTQRLIQPLNMLIKRTIELVITTIGGIIILPVIGIIAVLIKIDSPGSVFYGHHRLGLHGKSFKMWKFRSMKKDSKEALENLLATNPEAKAEWEASFKLKDDPRITRMGQFLRKTSLDELPQIWNVLRGEMCLIGPRPIIEAEVPKYGHHYKLFSSVKPGMTGLWQVSGRSDTDYEERVALDVYYIQSWSLWLDLYVLFKTIEVVVGGDGAY